MAYPGYSTPSVLLPDDLHMKVKAKIKPHRVSFSKLVRRLLEMYLNGDIPKVIIPSRRIPAQQL